MTGLQLCLLTCMIICIGAKDVPRPTCFTPKFKICSQFYHKVSRHLKEPNLFLVDEKMSAVLGDSVNHVSSGRVNVTCVLAIAESMNWTDANKTCVSAGGRLLWVLSPGDASILDLVNARKGVWTSEKAHSWIGLRIQYHNATADYRWFWYCPYTSANIDRAGIPWLISSKDSKYDQPNNIPFGSASGSLCRQNIEGQSITAVCDRASMEKFPFFCFADSVRFGPDDAEIKREDQVKPASHVVTYVLGVLFGLSLLFALTVLFMYHKRIGKIVSERGRGRSGRGGSDSPAEVTARDISHRDGKKEKSVKQGDQSGVTAASMMTMTEGEASKDSSRKSDATPSETEL